MFDEIRIICKNFEKQNKLFCVIENWRKNKNIANVINNVN